MRTLQITIDQDKPRDVIRAWIMIQMRCPEKKIKKKVKNPKNPVAGGIKKEYL